jgi:hypothetical protein
MSGGGSMFDKSRLLDRAARLMCRQLHNKQGVKADVR